MRLVFLLRIYARKFPVTSVRPVRFIFRLKGKAREGIGRARKERPIVDGNA